jgi:serine/threonine protein kinase
MAVESDFEASVIGGRYVLDRKLGSGGEGTIYLAYDQLLNRHVAIKSVKTGNEALTDASEGFKEARRLASLQHPSIVTIFDFLPSQENVFVVMEFINGESLINLTQPMEVRVFWDVASQSLDALGAAHSLGLVHRDIKSANIMVTWTEGGNARVKLLDFGLAKVMAAPAEQTLDHTGALTGSIYFISPEQLNCQPIDHRTDFYSLGCVFYHALTLRKPFQGIGIPSIIAAHLQHDFIPLAEYRPDLPAGLAAWVEKFFSFSPDDRPANATAALADLERLRNMHPAAKKPAAKPSPPQPAISNKPERRFPVWIAAVVTIMALAGIFSAVFLSEGKTPPPASGRWRGEGHVHRWRAHSHRPSRWENDNGHWRNRTIPRRGLAAFPYLQGSRLERCRTVFYEFREGGFLYATSQNLRWRESDGHRRCFKRRQKIASGSAKHESTSSTGSGRNT